MRAGFTLIELLIVVAIIAILAAIAVPNFLEAQVRAKASRVKADMRTLAGGMETYRIDHNAYPPHLKADGGEISYPERYVYLTTPVSYLTAIPAADPFYSGASDGVPSVDKWIGWTNFKSFPDTHALHPVKEKHQYLLRSRGPDAKAEENSVRNAYMNGGLAAGPSWTYDATNGTISRGELFRTAVEY